MRQAGRRVCRNGTSTQKSIRGKFRPINSGYSKPERSTRDTSVRRRTSPRHSPRITTGRRSNAPLWRLIRAVRCTASVNVRVWPPVPLNPNRTYRTPSTSRLAMSLACSEKSQRRYRYGRRHGVRVRVRRPFRRPRQFASLPVGARTRFPATTMQLTGRIGAAPTIRVPRRTGPDVSDRDPSSL